MVWKCFMFHSFSCCLPAFWNSATVPYRSYRQLTLLSSFGHFCKLLWYSTWTKSRTDHCFLDDISNFMEGWFFHFLWDRGSVCSLYPVTVSEMVFPAWVWIDFSLVTDSLLVWRFQLSLKLGGYVWGWKVKLSSFFNVICVSFLVVLLSSMYSILIVTAVPYLPAPSCLLCWLS